MIFRAAAGPMPGSEVSCFSLARLRSTRSTRPPPAALRSPGEAAAEASAPATPVAARAAGAPGEPPWTADAPVAGAAMPAPTVRIEIRRMPSARSWFHNGLIAVIAVIEHLLARRAGVPGRSGVGIPEDPLPRRLSHGCGADQALAPAAATAPP